MTEVKESKGKLKDAHALLAELSSSENKLREVVRAESTKLQAAQHACWDKLLADDEFRALSVPAQWEFYCKVFVPLPGVFPLDWMSSTDFNIEPPDCRPLFGSGGLLDPDDGSSYANVTLTARELGERIGEMDIDCLLKSRGPGVEDSALTRAEIAAAVNRYLEVIMQKRLVSIRLLAR